MKILYSLIASLFIFMVSAQSEASLVVSLEDGRYILSNDGASYFAKLSLECTNKPSPHYFYRALRLPGEQKVQRIIGHLSMVVLIGTQPFTIIGQW